MCPVDAQNESDEWRNGLSGDSTLASPASSAASPAQALQQLIRMHEELLAMLGAVIEQNQQVLEQNQQILEALNDATDDDDREPRTYLDGTPVNG